MKMASTKQVKKDEISPWILEALKVLKPPEKLTVSEWADKYRILGDKTSAEPGRWSTNRTPYLRGIMDSFTDVEVEEIIFCKCTQVGGSEAGNNMLGYIIAQDPGPTLVVYPNDDLSEFTSSKRLQPMIELSPVLKEKFMKNESKLQELNFTSMYIALTGANSAADLASRPVRYVIFDEIDKYPTNTGKEADPISLGTERTKTFANNKKIFKTSTPTLKRGPIWQEWLNADSQYKYFVPCPHCGEYQTFTFKQIKFDKSTPESARSTAYYECEKCHEKIHDAHKQQMLRDGKWEAIKKGGKRKIGFHINSIYSPWIRFGDVAYEFIASHNYPEKLMNFVNSWLGEPWEDVKQKMDSDIVYERQSEYTEGIVPNEAILLTGGIDIQKDCFYFTIRAWGYHLTSWNVLHGKVDTWDDLTYIFNQTFSSPKGKEYLVSLVGVDTGYNSEEAYEYCLDNMEWAKAVKGSSVEILQKYRRTTIDKLDSKAYGMELYIVDGGKYKDMISTRMAKENGIGSWMVYDGVDEDYAQQITSEEKVTERKGAREVSVWQKKTSHGDNHYLDCEVYAMCMADLLHVRYMVPETTKKQDEEVVPSEDGWLNNTKGWI